ncbi:2-aminoethylphosphonate--pyruvate transaminase [Maribellus sp. CM-23]|uniref:2-aminoethylphosphonate--pyruvate transaminase n=1 Tax=Maribellus sp. CM-23 TaxID=2781026 RepID=UPI001F3206BD|nr:2-aminoethylphosphonate--pyruvate transaminase [Maribellus sp. CM-23]MCE4566986.1 2-aminoethylphosphonate--pyruvate transaminase [Maribellus sp. CM-23]
MNIKYLPENPYLLLTPGPLSTSKTVKAAMLRDWCTWDEDYNSIVQQVRSELLTISDLDAKRYTTVLMQGSGTFSVESVIGSVIPESGKLLVLANGAYGQRIAEIARYLKIPCEVYDAGDLERHQLEKVDSILADDSSISHVAVVHCETTTGMLNDIEAIGEVVKKNRRIFVVDAMSSFGGIPIDVENIGIDFLISSANKCIQGVPGFGFVVGKTSELEKCDGLARSLSLDLFSQWKTLEEGHGKWRFTSPTHVVKAFRQALIELNIEGGILARFHRYAENQRTLVNGMRNLGLETLLSDEFHSPIITAFLSPKAVSYDFVRFYNELKARGFVIYPGKVTNYQCFRIGNIGEVRPNDMKVLISSVRESMYWK